MSDTSIGVVFGEVDEDKNERDIYYLNKMTMDSEKKHTSMEITC